MAFKSIKRERETIQLERIQMSRRSTVRCMQTTHLLIIIIPSSSWAVMPRKKKKEKRKKLKQENFFFLFLDRNYERKAIGGGSR